MLPQKNLKSTRKSNIPNKINIQTIKLWIYLNDRLNLRKYKCKLIIYKIQLHYRDNIAIEILNLTIFTEITNFQHNPWIQGWKLPTFISYSTQNVSTLSSIYFTKASRWAKNPTRNIGRDNKLLLVVRKRARRGNTFIAFVYTYRDPWCEKLQSPFWHFSHTSLPSIRSLSCYYIY